MRFLALLFATLALPGSFSSARASQVKATLLPTQRGIAPGSAATFLLRLEHAEKWHTYWVNPGEAGNPTRIVWALPEGWTATEPRWPAPRRFFLQEIVNYGYAGVAHILVDLTPPADAPPGEVEVSAKLRWLECDDESCVPGSAEVRARIAVRPGEAQPDPAQTQALTQALAALPQPPPTGFVFTASVDGNDWVLRVQAPASAGELSAAYFYAAEADWVNAAKPQAWTREGDAHLLRVTLAEGAAPPALPTGVLETVSAWPGAAGRALAVHIAPPSPATPPVSAVAVPSPIPTSPAPEPVGWLIILGSFLGGLLLNLMPCVFPVISLKVMSFVQQAHGDPRQALRHGMVFAAGVLISFWVFAALILGLKAAGQSVGWGFQFQDYRMPIGMSFLFLLLALNFFGVFEFGGSLTGLGQEAQAKSGYAGSFNSGVLAVLVATPCTGPFMGGAIGAALNQPGGVTVLIFSLLGLGMAFPYLILGARPKLLEVIPRPGEWMNSFKQALGFFMLGTVVFMYAILADQKPAAALVYLTGGLILAALGVWFYGRWGSYERPPRTRRLAAVAGLLGVGGGIAVALSFPEPRGLSTLDEATVAGLRERGFVRHHEYAPEALAELERIGLPVLWKPWDAAQVSAWQAEGRPVFIDFTATWCATCQVNKRSSLRQAEVERAFVQAGVEVMLADFTNEDPAILAELQRHGYAGVPLYLLYGRQPGQPPRILPNTLTPGIVLDAVRELGPAVK
jgi:thiol:disulfide interchange protein DsbD